MEVCTVVYWFLVYCLNSSDQWCYSYILIAPGLTLLVPYILTTKKRWSGCELRVFVAGTKKAALHHDQRQ